MIALTVALVALVLALGWLRWSLERVIDKHDTLVYMLTHHDYESKRDRWWVYESVKVSRERDP